MIKERNFSLDIIRVVACLMVILMHSPSSNSGLDGISYHCLDMFSEPCIGLFYMVSGALLLPVKVPYFDFIKRRLNKVVWPTIFFSIIVLLLALIHNEMTLQIFFKEVASIPFSTYKSGVLWFMYPLIGMYLLAPIISPYIEKASKREMQFLLQLWLITLCWKPLLLVLNVETTEESMLHVFSGYTGYFLLGYYLKKFTVRLPIFVFPILLLIPWGMDASNKIFHWGVSKYDYFWYLSIFCVMQSVAWYQMITQYCPPLSAFPSWLKNLVISFSNCSFGIYLMHRIVIQRIMWNVELLNILHPYLQVFLTVVFTTIISWVLTIQISRLPFANYIVGVSNRRITTK